MSYRLLPGKIYRMPTHFGPALGPRQGPGGRRYENKGTPKGIGWSVSFLANRAQLEQLIPDGMGLKLGEEPIVTVSADYGTDIEWLAGRGYNTLGVTFPVVFDGQRDHVKGNFMIVLWENMCDPIVTGRDELGFSKIWCEIPDPITYQGETHCTASWLGYRFMDMRVRNLKPLSPEEISAMSKEPAQGLIHYKYIPRTGEWGETDVSCITTTPPGGDNGVVLEMCKGEGTVQFHEARWEDMPTQCHIANALHELEIKEYRGAMMVRGTGGKDLSDQRILR
jgi:hypothetical protein